MSDDPLESIAAGATKGGLEHFEEKVSELIQKIRDRKIAFIQQPENIELVREQRRKPEWQLFRDYVSDKRLVILIEMGLALRDLESDPGYFKRIQTLRDRIRSKYGDEGLHIAQVVQSGILLEAFEAALQQSADKPSVGRLIEKTLNEADRFCIFVQEDDDAKRRAKEILTRLDANQPQSMYLLSKGNANRTLMDVYKRLRDDVPGYEWSRKDKGNSILLTLTKRRGSPTP